MSIPTAIVPSIQPAEMTARQVKAEYDKLLRDGARIVCNGDAKDDPQRLLRLGHGPKSKLTLFGTRFYLSNPRQNPDLRFFVAYVIPPSESARPKIFPRIFYKDISLIWRAASHLFLEGADMWIGKGDTRQMQQGDWSWEDSVESTTDLPFEMQTAVETLNRSSTVRQAMSVLPLVLKRAPRQRIRAYDDFLRPRLTAARDPKNRINRGRPVVSFKRSGDPRSMRVVAGFEPDFEQGMVEHSVGHSRFYGGKIHRYRIVSANRKIQHLFMCAPQHVWMIPPQALTTELSSFGVRTIDVHVDDDAYVPGYEYHFFEDAEDDQGDPVLHSQIPEGYAGLPNPDDDTRVDASAWLDKLPLLNQFRNFVAREP